MIINVAKNGGQLGNQLWFQARVMSLAFQTKQTFINYSIEVYSPFYKATKGRKSLVYAGKKNCFIDSEILLICLYPVIRFFFLVARKMKLRNYFFRYIDFENNRPSEENLITEISGSLITFVEGWNVPRHKTPGPVKELIDDSFVPLDKYLLRYKQLFADCRVVNDILVAVHIRRGDYKEFMNGIYFFEDEVYRDYMKKFAGFFEGKKVVFILCSNEAITIEAFNGLDCRISGGNFVEDNYILSQCDFIIGPPSTYSMWASFFGDSPLYFLHKKDNQFDEIHLNKFKIFI
ncbi:MAG: alpha-1,2-fucosyltransferase [Cytophagaceae bacterium]